MSAERLREAARLMRERAEAVVYMNDGSVPVWRRGAPDGYGNTPTIVVDGDESGEYVAAGMCDDDAAHIASWHPAVALAVADWLDDEAQRFEDYGSKIRICSYEYTEAPPTVLDGATNSKVMYVDPDSFKNAPAQPSAHAVAVARAYLVGLGS